jgi:Tfp pilus assembly protein PilX
MKTKSMITKRQQTGFVSIIVTLILMVITSMLVLSFAFLARQNMNRNLNQQLSTQAFYAAESGVNDAVAKLKAGTLSDTNSCGDTPSIGNQVLGADDLNVKYTCVLVNQSPTDLKYDGVATDTSTVVHINAPSATTLKISWQDSGADNVFAPSTSKFYLPQLPVINKALAASGRSVDQTADFPNHTGLLRATVIPTSAATSDNILLNSSRNFFLYPRANASPNQQGASDMSQADGQLVSGECNTGNNSGAYPLACNAVVTGVPTDFYLRLRSVYKPVAVRIQMFDGSVAQPIKGAQAVIDATGKAQDVLRRIQVRVPLSPSFMYPEFALETADSICKRFAVYPGGAAILTPSATNEAGLYGGTDPNNAKADQTACSLPGLPAPSFP